MIQARKAAARARHPPLLQFLVLGGLVFALLPGPDPTAPVAVPDRIGVPTAEVAQLAAAWAARAQRPPTVAEREAIIAEAVREQVLYREVLAWGLDRDDVVIRHHLRQKFEFGSRDPAYDADPDEATLRAFPAARDDRYARGARLSFRHILFSPDRRGADAQTDAVRALAGLQSATGPKAADRLDDVTSLPPGRWSGPVASG